MVTASIPCAKSMVQDSVKSVKMRRHFQLVLNTVFNILDIVTFKAENQLMPALEKSTMQSFRNTSLRDDVTDDQRKAHRQHLLSNSIDLSKCRCRDNPKNQMFSAFTHFRALRYLNLRPLAVGCLIT